MVAAVDDVDDSRGAHRGGFGIGEARGKGIAAIASEAGGIASRDEFQFAGGVEEVDSSEGGEDEASSRVDGDAVDRKRSFNGGDGSIRQDFDEPAVFDGEDGTIGSGGEGGRVGERGKGEEIPGGVMARTSSGVVKKTVPAGPAESQRGGSLRR